METAEPTSRESFFIVEVSFAFITYFKREREKKLHCTLTRRHEHCTTRKDSCRVQRKFYEGLVEMFLPSYIFVNNNNSQHQNSSIKKKKLQNHFLFWKMSTELGCGGYCMVSTRFWSVFHGFRLVLLGSTQFLFIIKAEHFPKFLLTRYFCLLFEKCVNTLISSKMKRNLSICFSGILPRKRFITNPLNESF